MQVLFIVLNQIDSLEEILEQLVENGIAGATIIDSKGMAQTLYENSDIPFMMGLRSLLEPAHTENKTIFLILEEDKIPVVSRVVNEVTGGLDLPDTGIIFSFPIHYIEGINS